MRRVRMSTFETNSSSTHALSYDREAKLRSLNDSVATMISKLAYEEADGYELFAIKGILSEMVRIVDQEIENNA